MISPRLLLNHLEKMGFFAAGAGKEQRNNSRVNTAEQRITAVVSAR
jgi:hypothetical protein